jgi:hypothetical protein
MRNYAVNIEILSDLSYIPINMLPLLPSKVGQKILILTSLLNNMLIGRYEYWDSKP